MFKGSLLGLIVLSYVSLMSAHEGLIEAKASYFHPTDPNFRDIYGGGWIYGLEASYGLWKGLYAWGSSGYFHQSGLSKGSYDSTHVTFVPCGLGLKYLFTLDTVDLYLGAGALGTYGHTTNDSSYVARSQSKWGFGGIAKIGVILNIKRFFFIDLFSDYSWMKIHFHNHDAGVLSNTANFNGWSIGIALGYRFGKPQKPRPVMVP